MLDMQQLQDQMTAFQAHQAKVQTRRKRQLAAAEEALWACDDEWEAVRDEVDRAKPRELVAAMREAPANTADAPDRPTPVTVVATDGSQIYPDRHVEPPCYLINVSQIAFQYGTTEAPVMTASADFEYGDAVQEHFEDEIGAMTTEVVSALRDEKELEGLLDIARSAQVTDRPLLAMADGTLIRWMIRGMRNRQLEDELIRRYTAMLKEFMADELPLCSYVSMPGNTEVIHLLQFYHDRFTDAPDDLRLDGLTDRRLFARTLAPGERTAVFSSPSHIQREYPEGNKICYFYVNIPDGGQGEIGRVEIPEWVADDPALLRFVHSVVLSECAKGDGYPMILSEAHERAVIRARERDGFYQMLERAMRGAGLPASQSQKQASKRRPRV